MTCGDRNLLMGYAHPALPLTGAHPAPYGTMLAEKREAAFQATPLALCYCTGPRPGEPLCPCQMRDQRVHQRDGRWIRPEQDLGAVHGS